jgi:hypothetical protein
MTSLRSPSTGNDQFFKVIKKSKSNNWSLVIGHWSLKAWSLKAWSLRSAWHLPRKLAVSLIKLYQKTLSPDHSKLMKPIFPHGHCKYTPSCSEYSKLAYQKNGFIVGILKSVWRVIRCNPLSKGGIDLP